MGTYQTGLYFKSVTPTMHFVLIIVINCLSDIYLLPLLKMTEYERMY